MTALESKSPRPWFVSQTKPGNQSEVLKNTEL